MKATYQITSAKIRKLLLQCLTTMNHAFLNDPFGSYPLLCLENLKGERDIYPPPHPLCFTGKFSDLALLESECKQELSIGNAVTFLTAMKGHKISFDKKGIIKIEGPYRFISNWGGSQSYIPQIIRELEDDEVTRIESSLGVFLSFEKYYQARGEVCLPCHWDWKGNTLYERSDA